MTLYKIDLILLIITLNFYHHTQHVFVLNRLAGGGIARGPGAGQAMYRLVAMDLHDEVSTATNQRISTAVGLYMIMLLCLAMEVYWVHFLHG